MSAIPTIGEDGTTLGKSAVSEPPSYPRRTSDWDTSTGTPQGGIPSPLLANVALTVLDDPSAGAWGGDGRLHPPPPAGTEALREETAAVLRPMGLRLSEAKTRIVRVDHGFDFLGFRIRRAPKRARLSRAPNCVQDQLPMPVDA